jgi:hypothetical protein
MKQGDARFSINGTKFFQTQDSCFSTYPLLATGAIQTGFPYWLICTMSAVALGFSIFDLTAYFLSFDSACALATIARLNSAYCIGAMIRLLLLHKNTSWLGYLYFCVECLIVIPLCWWDSRVALRS